MNEELYRAMIEYLVSQLWDLVSDGDDPDFDEINRKLTELGFDPQKLMPY